MDFNKIDSSNYNEFTTALREMGDEKYRDFNSKIVKDTAYEIIGIRLPELRAVAKQILRGDYESFLSVCRADCYEEVMLRGLVTAQISGSFEKTAERIDGFIPYIDNWAVCDTFCSTFKGISRFEPEYFEHIDGYVNSENPWAVRAGFVLMMNYYLTDEYIDRVLAYCESVKSSEYYVQMAKAWLLATAFVKYREKTLHFLQTAGIDNTTLNMTIQKCVDSYRISKEDKSYLRTLRRR